MAPPFIRLYFFGLEYRLLMEDHEWEEHLALLSEVKRLQRLYGDGYGLEDEVDLLLEAQASLIPEVVDADPRQVLERLGRGLPTPLAVGLGHQVSERIPLSADWVLCVWLAQRGTRLRASQRAVFDEFAELFRMRFDKWYPNGLKFRPARSYETLVYEALVYEAASEAFSIEVPFLKVGSVARPLSVARRLARECYSDLERYIRFVGRNRDGRGTLEAHTLLPCDLALSRSSEAMGALHDWAERCVGESGGLSRIDRVLERFEGTRPSLVRKQKLVRCANALALGAFGLAPDPRYTSHLPGPRDRAVLYRLPRAVCEPARVSHRYLPTLRMLRLVAYVARSGGTVSDAKRDLMVSMIEGRDGLRAVDRRRLLADIGWLLTKWRGCGSLKRTCDALAQDKLEEVCRLAVQVARAGGAVHSAEIVAIQKLYRAMGRPEDDVFAGLVGVSPASPTQPVTVRGPARARPGYSLRRTGSRKDRRRSVDLDDGRITEILADTREVSKVLAEVFVEDEPAQSGCGAAPGSVTAQPAVYDGLDGPHAALVKGLLKRPSWKADEFARMAMQCGLMPGGALEAVNEWSFERFGEALVDEDVELEVNPDILEALPSETVSPTDATA